MNPIHQEYLKCIPFNNLNQLFEITDNLDPRKRDDAMMCTFMQFVKLKKSPDAGPHDRLGDTLTDFTNYNRCKTECGRLPKNVSESFLVYGIVSHTLAYCYGRAEMDKARVVARHQEIIEDAEADVEDEPNEANRDSLRDLIEKTRHKINNIGEEIGQAKELYAYVCENLVRLLMDKWQEQRRQRGFRD
jgi:hypothetical protein